MRLNFCGDTALIKRRWLWILAIACLAAPRAADAAVATVGDVTPSGIAPAGGNVAGPMRVGNTLFGSLTVSNGPAINVQGSNAGTIVGDSATGIGLVTLSGFNSNLTTVGDLTIGNAGSGSVAVQSTAQVTMADDLLMGVMEDSTGDLFADSLGTVINVTDTALIGQAGTALAQVTNGARVLADDTIIGQSATGDGRIVVSGHSSLWQQDNAITIGDAGRGDLQLLAQGRMDSGNVVMGSAATGVGLALVNGTGSFWDVTGFMNIGVLGNANLRIFEGGRVIATGAARLATTAGSEAHVTVSGNSSQWTLGTGVTVGESGFATLDVLSGGRVVSGAVKLGDNVGSRGSVTVSGPDSTWEITGALDVSEPGEASLTIASGGLVTTSGVTRIAAAGQLLMGGGRLEAGSGGVFNSGLIDGGGRIVAPVTNNATGKLRVRGGFQLVLTEGLTNAGTIDVAGGELEVLGATVNTLDIDARDATLRFGGGLSNNALGALAITEGTVDVFGAVTNASGAQIVVGAEAHGVFHDPVTNNGQLFVMPGANLLALENLTLGGSALMALQLGSEETQEDGAQVEVGGLATLAGNLQVNLASGFAPQLGDSFQVVSAAGGVSGTFAQQALPTLGGGLAWDVDYSATAVTLNVVAGATADFNGDGFVNSADFAIFKGGFGTVGTADQGDGDTDGDNDVDGSDFLAWQQQFGAVPDAAPAAGAVPEPACGLMLAMGAAALGMRRRASR